MRRLPALLCLVLGCSPSLTVDDVSPPVVPAGAGTPLTIQGSGFSEDVGFRLEGAGLEIGLGPFLELSVERVRVSVPEAAPAGIYSVVAEDGIERAELVDAVEIVEGETHVIFLDIGQGDATLVIAPGGEVALIDGGPIGARAALQDALDVYAHGRLDVALLSHTDADHLGGLVGVLAGKDTEVGTPDDLDPPIKLAPLDDGSCDTLTCRRWRALGGAPFATAVVGEIVPLGDVELEIVAVDGDTGDGPNTAAQDPNERSLVVRVRFAGRDVLILGDLTGGGLNTANIEEPLSSHTGPVDILRTAHHGSRTSSNELALARWDPLASVISVGTDNTFCHPDPGVLQRVSDYSGRVVGTGAGILSRDTCDDTPAFENVSLNVGDVLLRIGRDGALNLAGNPL